MISGGKPKKINDEEFVSESMIQADIYSHFIGKGYRVLLEYPTSDATMFNKSGRIVLDVVVVRDGVPVAIFEVKKPKEIIKPGSKHYLKQQMSLVFFWNNGIPSAFVCSLNEAVEFFNKYCSEDEKNAQQCAN